jgi:hypothetical protein
MMCCTNRQLTDLLSNIWRYILLPNFITKHKMKPFCSKYLSQPNAGTEPFYYTGIEPFHSIPLHPKARHIRFTIDVQVQVTSIQIRWMHLKWMAEKLFKRKRISIILLPPLTNIRPFNILWIHLFWSVSKLF